MKRSKPPTALKPKLPKAGKLPKPPKAPRLPRPPKAPGLPKPPKAPGLPKPPKLPVLATDAAGALEDDDVSGEQLVLSDLINRVLDKGVVISSHITISIADVDLIQLDLKLLISSVATLTKRAEDSARHGDLPVRSRPRP